MAATNLQPVHPGEVLLEEFLKPFDMGAEELSERTGIKTEVLQSVLDKRAAILADHALRLGKYFGNSPEFWLGLQSDYDLDIAKAKLGDRLEKEIVPLAA